MIYFRNTGKGKPVSSIDRFLDEAATAGTNDLVLQIVPTNRKVRQLRHRIIQQAAGKLVNRINVETIFTLAQKIAKLLYPEFRLISEAEKSVFIEKSFRTVKPVFFKPYKGEIPLGIRETIGYVISEYKRHGVTPESLEMQLDTEPDSYEKKKGEGVVQVCKDYNRQLLEYGTGEIGDLFLKLEQHDEQEVSAAFRKLYPDITSVLVYGFSEFTNGEIILLKRISSVDSLNTAIDLPYIKENNELFSILSTTAERLVLHGFQENNHSDSSFAHNEFARIMAEGLFRFQKRKGESGKLPLLADKVSFLSGSGISDEVTLIAKRIKLLHTEGKVPLESIAVVFNLISKYSDTVREVFSHAGIPFNLTDRIRLDRMQPVKYLISVLELQQQGFLFKALLKVVSSPYSPHRKLTPALKELASQFRIGRGLHAWRTILNPDSPVRLKSKKPAVSDASIADVSSLFDTLESYLKPFQQPLDYRQFATEIKKLIWNLNIPKDVANLPFSDIELHSRAVAELIQTVDELFALLARENPGKKFSLSHHLEILKTAIGSARCNIKEKPGYGVLITSAEELRGLSYDYLFIGGLCDGDFPTRYEPQVFLSGDVRRSRNEKRHMDEQRLLFFQALGSWRKELILTASQTDGKEPLVESYFVSALFRILEREDYHERAKILKSGLNNVVISKMEFQAHPAAMDNNQLDETFAPGFTKDDFLSNASALRKRMENGKVATLQIAEHDELRQYLENHLERTFSVTSLETYAKCPFQYLCKQILKLKEFREPDADTESSEYGTLLHTIYEQFYTRWNEEIKKPIPGCDDEVFGQAKNILWEVAEKVLEENPLLGPFAFYEREKILGVNSDDPNALLSLFLATEWNDKSGFLPSELEFKFGNTDNPLPEYEFAGVKLQGKIDRIDVNDEKNTFRVVDYKSGSIKSLTSKSMRDRLFQLPVYGAAVSAYHTESTLEDLLYYSLKAVAEKSQLLARKSLSEQNNADAIKDKIATAKESIQKILQSIKEGQFDLTSLTTDAPCRYCEFDQICRINEVIGSADEEESEE